MFSTRRSGTQVRAKAAVRAEVLDCGLHDETIDPGERLLRLVTQSAALAWRYASQIEQMVAEQDGDLRKALIHTGQFGESVRAMVKLENEERDVARPSLPKPLLGRR